MPYAKARPPKRNTSPSCMRVLRQAPGVSRHAASREAGRLKVGGGVGGPSSGPHLSRHASVNMEVGNKPRGNGRSSFCLIRVRAGLAGGRIGR